MNRIIYCCSATFDYGKMICDDAGPQYARKFGWEVRPITSGLDALSSIIVLDTRLTRDECNFVREKFLAGTNAIWLRITDPCFEAPADNPIYELVSSLEGHSRANFLLQYQPVEWTLRLKTRVGSDRIYVLPYPYNQEREVELGKQRRRQVVLTGAAAAHYYPNRVRLYRRRRYDPLMRLGVDVLSHPGYPDVGHPQQHNIVGENYINYLSQYAFMFMCPSRAGLELLKYSECAYAGCVPVGESPVAFEPELRAHVLPFDSNWRALLRLFCLGSQHIEFLARSYRDSLRRLRHPDLLNRGFHEFVAAQARAT